MKSNLNHQMSAQISSPSKKRLSPPFGAPAQPHKRPRKLLDDDDSDSKSGTTSTQGNATIQRSENSIGENGFKINQDFARRFEHNKNREELHRLEGRYGKQPDSAPMIPRTRTSMNGQSDTDGESSSDSESEDNEGILVSENLDAQIGATLDAIRNKDPRIYDEKITFYTDVNEVEENGVRVGERKIRPMYLNDYHRQNLLEGSKSHDGDETIQKTYAQQQDDLKSTLIREMHGTTTGLGAREDGHEASDSKEEDDGDFLVRKPSKHDLALGNQTEKLIELNVDEADKDPETYLAKFMAARAWVPSEKSQLHPFESEDEEDERRADEFEEAYNLRFEDPEGANEKLVSHARDAAAKYSVRQEHKNNRKKARDAERAKKDALKREREEEKARLRKLRIAEAEQKINKIKQAAGFRGKAIQEQEWAAFLDEGWDDAVWEQEMNKRFGDAYYADQESEDAKAANSRGKDKPRKPKWDDEIDIGDLVPDFEVEGSNSKVQFSLSDDEDGGSASFSEDGETPLDQELLNNHVHPMDGPKNSIRRRRDEQKTEARKRRKAIERLVDEKLSVEDTLSSVGGKKGHFRYRETSPLTFGLNPRDILMASDSQLNEYAGLKKLAAYRDPIKKQKDKKRLGKKARLRAWRKETFGNDEGPQKSLGEFITEQTANNSTKSHAKKIKR